MCLNMKVEAGEDVTNEEMSLFLQGNPGLGMQLSLQDFDCRNAQTPTWLPTEKWEDILALSVLPGPLDSLCVDFAVNGDDWKEWYNNPYPEKLALPYGGGGQTFRKRRDEEEGKEKTDEGTEKEERDGGRGSAGPTTPPAEGGHLNEFHRLLLLRMLRPDRLPTALLTYTQRHLALYDPEEEVFNVNEVLKEARKHLGVLVLLPPPTSDPRGHPAMRLKLTRSPVEELITLAEAAKIPVERAVVSEGGFLSVEEALDAADKHEGWAIIEGIHLTTPQLLAKLTSHLQRIHKSRVNFKDEQGEESKFCVFLTSGTNSNLPASLVQDLLKVAWNSVLSYPDLSAKTDSQKDDGEEKKLPEIFNPLSPRSYLKTAIVSAVRLIPVSALERMQESDCPQISRALIFAVAVLHGLLTSRQLMGSVGLARWHPFGASQVAAAVQAILSPMLLVKDETEPPLEDLVFTISELVYGAMVAEETDRKYIHALCEHVIGSVYKEPQSEILLGGTLIPVPPATADPMEYAEWFEQTADDKMTLKTLQLNTTVERFTNEASSTNFVARLDRMFETQNMEAGDMAIPPPSTTASLLAGAGTSAASPGGAAVPALLPSVSTDKLRSALDICLEHLPLLLDLGEEASQLLMRQDYDFPYHCPSIISMSSAESALMPESIGYVLLQECLWMNTALCHIRQEIADLQANLVGGPGALPKQLLPTALSVQEEYVPTSWIHPNCQPCTHSLVTWLADLNKRHAQLNRWVRRSMVPTFNLSKGQVHPRTIARGQLSSVWLGGLVNPGALLTALRQERAILARVGLEDVQFHAVVLTDASQADFELEEGGIFVTDLILENAAWSFEENGLMEAKDEGVTNLKCVYLRPVVRTPKHVAAVIADPDVSEEQVLSERRTPSTKNATIGEDVKSTVSKEETKQVTGSGEEVNQADNKTVEEGEKEPAETERPKSQASQKSAEPAKAEDGAADVKVEDDEEDRANEAEDGALPPGMVELPMYMNKSRQILIWSLPVRSTTQTVNWTLCRSAFVLDEGLPEGGCKKSRAYLMLQRLQPMMRPGEPEDEEEGQEEEDDGRDEELEEEEEEINIEGDSGAESTRSQLSYKPMSPKAPPLPEGLGLQREHPLANERDAQKEGDGQSGEGARPVSRMSAQSRGREEGTNVEKQPENLEEKETEEAKNTEAFQSEVEGGAQNTSRGDEPAAEKLDRQAVDDRGGDLTQAKEGETSAVESGGQDGAQSQPGEGEAGAGSQIQAQEVVSHPGSRQASRRSQRDAGTTNMQEADSEERATADSRTNTAGGEEAAHEKSAKKRASAKGTGGRGAEDETPLKPTPKPPTPAQKSRQEATPAPSGLAAASGTGSKPASREAPIPKPPSRGKTVSREKPASREKLASRDSQKKATPAAGNSDVNKTVSNAGEGGPKEEADNQENLAGGQEGAGGRGMDEEPPAQGDSTQEAVEQPGVTVAASERSEDTGHVTLDMQAPPPTGEAKENTA